ncbi:uncharacterized protein DS421_12g384880 [Arachis hypogaea]|nr:uncharacterized protein DS421_12g384880 [Arachis hypogaea]
MTKYRVLYALIIMLIIGKIICYVNVEFDGFVRDDEKMWIPSIDDAYDLNSCYRKCNEAYDSRSSRKSRNRRQRCRESCKRLNRYIEWCKERCRGDEDAYKKCIEAWISQIQRGYGKNTTRLSLFIN